MLQEECQNFEQRQRQRLYGNPLLAIVDAAFGRGEGARSERINQRRQNAEEFCMIARTLVDTIGHGTLTFAWPSRAGNDLYHFRYYAQLWTENPLIDGHNGDVVSALTYQPHRPHATPSFETRVTYLELNATATDSELMVEGERTNLIGLLNRHGVEIERENMIRIHAAIERQVRMYELRAIR